MWKFVQPRPGNASGQSGDEVVLTEAWRPPGDAGADGRPASATGAARPNSATGAARPNSANGTARFMVGVDGDAKAERQGSKNTLPPPILADGPRLFVETEEMKEKVRKAIIKPSYNVLDMYKTEGIFQRIARAPCFEYITLVLISVNAIWIAVDCDYNTADTLIEAEPHFVVMENIFCSYFTLEILIRFMAFRRTKHAFMDPWFLFDWLLVVLMIVETWVLTIIMAASSGGRANIGLKSVSILRLFKLSRLARFARMLRSVPELMILIKGMASATRSVFFVMCLLVCILYAFSIALKQVTRETDTVGPRYFGNVASGMSCLIVHGLFFDNFGDVWDELAGESPLGLVVFCLFVLLASLTMLNLLVGILCEVVTVTASTEREEMMVSFLTQRMRELLEQLDENGDMKISKAEFMKIVAHPEAAKALEEVGVDPIGIVDFANYIFNVEGLEGEEAANVKLSFEEFMDVVLKLRGSNTATVKDIVDLRKFVFDAVNDLEVMLTKPGQPHHRKTLRDRPKASAVKGQPGKASDGESDAESLQSPRVVVGAPSAEARELVQGHSPRLPPLAGHPITLGRVAHGHAALGDGTAGGTCGCASEGQVAALQSEMRRLDERTARIEEMLCRVLGEPPGVPRHDHGDRNDVRTPGYRSSPSGKRWS